jgi:hypothetical protein
MHTIMPSSQDLLWPWSRRCRHRGDMWGVAAASTSPPPPSHTCSSKLHLAMIMAVRAAAGSWVLPTTQGAHPTCPHMQVLCYASVPRQACIYMCVGAPAQSWSSQFSGHEHLCYLTLTVSQAASLPAPTALHHMAACCLGQPILPRPPTPHRTAQQPSQGLHSTYDTRSWGKARYFWLLI